MHDHESLWNRFRIFCFCLLAFTLASIVIEAQTTAEKKVDNTLQLKIWTDRHAYTQNGEIPVHLQLTNISSHDVFIGRELWAGNSFSRVELDVEPRDGHALSYMQSAVDGLPPHPFDDLPKAVLNWCLSLPPGYSYGVTTPLQQFVNPSGLLPGVYRVSAQYVSSGIDADKYFNPLLGHPDELTKLMSESWSGRIASNVITIRIIASTNRSERDKGSADVGRPISGTSIEDSKKSRKKE